LIKLKKDKLLNQCTELNIKVSKTKKKDELIDLILNLKISDKKNILNEEENTINGEENIINNNKKIKFIDLFCGIGGFHQALKNIDGECVFACDIDKECRKIYEINYNLKPNSDITKVNISKIPHFDVLCGGFPCQPFSNAGFQKGFDDNRGNLFFNICNIVKYHKPKYLLLENVRNLSSHDDGNTWKVIYKNIDDLGYYTYVEPIILNVLHFNIPQNRERVIIMCKRKDLGNLPNLPQIPSNPKLSLTKNIKDFIYECDKEENKKYIIDGKLKYIEKIWNNFIEILIENNKIIPKFPIWTDWWDNQLNTNDLFYKKYTSLIDKNRKFYSDNKTILEKWLNKSRENENWFGAVRKFEWQAGNLLQNDGMSNVLWSARGSGIRVKRPNYIPTLVAMSMIPVYGPESRKLSPKELLRLQSFPDTFYYNEKTIYKQVGNAVNVKMIEKCARFLILNEDLF
jgi:DNA (cytosine-5)-methyltransferase 1